MPAAQPATWPAFPVDPATLDLIEHSLQGVLDDSGELHGADFSFGRLLEFLSGYDPALSVRDQDCEDLCHYLGHLFGERDAILALITEVRRLRTLLGAA